MRTTTRNPIKSAATSARSSEARVSLAPRVCQLIYILFECMTDAQSHPSNKATPTSASAVSCSPPFPRRPPVLSRLSFSTRPTNSGTSSSKLPHLRTPTPRRTRRRERSTCSTGSEGQRLMSLASPDSTIRSITCIRRRTSSPCRSSGCLVSLELGVMLSI